MIITCHCGRQFETDNPRRLHCDKDCRLAWHKKQKRAAIIKRWIDGLNAELRANKMEEFVLNQ